MRLKEKPTLDKLLDYKRPVSPPFEAEIGEQKIKVALKYIPGQAITECNQMAAGRLLKAMQREGLDDKFLSSQIAFQDLEREQSMALLAEVLVDPDSESGCAPAFSYDRLRECITPTQVQVLDEQWTVWQTRKDLSSMTVEDAEKLKEAEKKSDVEGFCSIILSCGSPLNSMRFLVRELITSQTSKSSDGS